MKNIFKILVVIAVGLVGSISYAQTATEAEPTNLYSVGLAWNQSGTPEIAGSALYAKILSATSGTWAFTDVDFLPTSKKPFTVTTNINAGIAQKALSFYAVNFYVPTSAGVSFTGTNTGWAWTSGILADYTIKKDGKKTSFHLQPNVRWLKSSVSGGSDYQFIFGTNFGWTK
jgi:hypothetical protein